METDLKIDDDFIFKKDLRKWLFKEDENGIRYRERIQDKIEEFGVKKWFIKMGYPTEMDSIWKNRYTGDKTTLKEDIMQYAYARESNKRSEDSMFEDRAFYLWENWLPIGLWVNDDLKNEGLNRWLN